MNIQDNKEIMARNIMYQMEKKGVTIQQVCDALDFKYTTFRDWIKAITYPRIGKIEAMANYFGCEKSDLIEDKTIATHPVEMAERHFEMVMDEDLNEIFDYLKCLNERDRKTVKDLARSLAESKTEA